jgi:GNAT superfamily N-acetyltransferase
MEVSQVVGRGIEPYLREIAALRITVFREFPYLYEGDLEYEMTYLRPLLNSPTSLVVLVRVNNRCVGASTGLPLRDADEEFQRPFSQHGYELNDFFYLGESVLLPEYRGQGLGHQFFDLREAQARRDGCTRTCFCSVNRALDHPRRPAAHRSLEPFWEGRGYAPLPGLVAEYPWLDLNEPEPTTKTLQFWGRL